MSERETLPYAALGRRIAELRHRAKLSQRDAARIIPMSPGYLPQIERGKSRPEPDVLRRIADVFDADEHELAILAGYVRPAVTPDAYTEASAILLDEIGQLREALDARLEAMRARVNRVLRRPPDEPAPGTNQSPPA